MAKSLGDLYYTLSARTQGFTQQILSAGKSLSVLEEISSITTGQIVRFGAEAVTAFLDAEKATKRLELAAAASHSEVEGLAGALGTWADATERATGVDGDYIKSLQQLLLQLNAAPNEVNRATKAALDWAAATGGSARSALMLFTRASEGSGEELKKWGITVEESQLQARGLSAVLDEVEKKYGGTADQMDEVGKALAAQRAAWGDLKEAIGGYIVRASQLGGVAKFITAQADAWTYLLSKQDLVTAAASAQRATTSQSDRIAAAINTEIHFIEQLRQAEAELDMQRRKVVYGPTVEAAAARVAALQAELAAVSKARKEMQGISTAPQKLRLPEMDLGSGAAASIARDIRAAADEYERFQDMVDRQSDYASRADSRQQGAGLAAAQAAEAAGFKAMELEAQFADDIEKMAREAAEESAEAMTRAARAEEEAAAGASRRMYEESRAFAASATRAAQEAQDAIVNRALGALGDVASVISNAANAAAGGPGAVFASVAVDLLSRSQAFQQLVGTLNGLVQSLADGLGPLVTPLIPLVGAVGLLVEPLAQLAGSLGTLLVEAVEPLTPIIVMAATVMQGLLPVLTLLMKATLLVHQPLAMLGGPILKGLFDVLKFVGVMVLEVAQGLGNAWNGIVGAVQAVFRELADISLGPLGHPLGFLDGWARSLDSARVDTDEMAKQIAELTGLSYELALAKAKEHAATLQNYDALKRTNQELANVPQRWRRALRTAQAEDRQAPPGTGWAGGGSGGMPPPGTPGGHGAGPVGGGMVGGFFPIPSMPSTPPPPINVGGLFRFPGMGGAGAQSAPPMAPGVVNIFGYEIGPALAQAAKTFRLGAANRSYAAGGSITTTAGAQFGAGLAPAGG